ncbi:hypothetical protein C0J52_14011 [Blattella germanica]|nr:hypothetical protein C0J52_14011 [Blattella germanica]
MLSLIILFLLLRHYVSVIFDQCRRRFVIQLPLLRGTIIFISSFPVSNMPFLKLVTNVSNFVDYTRFTQGSYVLHRDDPPSQQGTYLNTRCH